jgi:hypothetical protein
MVMEVGSMILTWDQGAHVYASALRRVRHQELYALPCWLQAIGWNPLVHLLGVVQGSRHEALQQK